MSSKLMKMALAALVFACAGAPAEDIDLFVGAPPPADLPNVLIVIDNTANWSTAFTAEMATLASAIAGLDTGKFRLGFMMYSETGGGNGSPDGAYVRAAVRTMTAGAGGTQDLYQKLVKSFDVINDKSNNAKLGLTMSEVNQYFSGARAYAGANKVKRDYHLNSVPGLTNSNNVYALDKNALSLSTSTVYQSPVTGGCQNDYVIFLSNGKSTSNASDNSTATTQLAAVGGDTTVIPLSPSGFQTEVADEWARYLANKVTNPVITYVIDVVPTVAGQYSTDYKALLQSMATQGKGKYFNVGSAGAADLGAKLSAALGTVFSEIQSVNSAFASASLPVSANIQGRFLNQVFVGMFRPNSDGTPRWYGNLKQYQFRADVDPSGKSIVSFRLVDKTGNYDVVSTLSGFVSPCAQSFWTTADTYWPSGYAGNCLLSGLTDVRSNSPDGEIVEKGAAAQRLRAVSVTSAGVDARNVKTCNGCTSTLDTFGTGAGKPSIAALGVADAATQTALINWARGENVDNELSKGTLAVRPSVHGDVVHSAPLAVNYGGTDSTTPPNVVVFYGGNDGMLHAVNGNPDVGLSLSAGKSIGSATPGDELWSFIAPEHYGKLARLRSNSPGISFPGAAAGSTPKDYFFDGPIGIYRSDDLGTTWIYPTMRRGGRTLYAFDVSTPDSPSLLWKIGCPKNFPSSGTVDDTGCTTGFADIGQTWSDPQVVKVAGYSTNPVLIMGGGYDLCEDQDKVPNDACTASRKGNRVFVLDAKTGALLKTLGTGAGDGDAILGSIAAAVTVVDSNSDGVADYAYAVDTLANLYRINIGTLAPASWTITRIASLGCDSGVCGRKFLDAPTVRLGDATVAPPIPDMVLVGSGNRERPLLANAATSVQNAFFMIKDDHSASPSVITTSDMVSIDPDSTTLSPAQTTALASSTNKGWYLAFGTGRHVSEQVVTSAALIGGVTFFSTNQPVTPTGCGANLGKTRGYAVSFLDASTPGGTSKFSTFIGGGLPPSPVAGVASIILTKSDGTAWTKADGSPVTASVPFIIGGGGAAAVGPSPNITSGCGSSGLGGCLITINPHHVPKRVYWYIQQ